MNCETKTRISIVILTEICNVYLRMSIAHHWTILCDERDVWEEQTINRWWNLGCDLQTHHQNAKWEDPEKRNISDY